MTNKELQDKVEFIIEQQARVSEFHTRFAADLQLLNESHTRFAADLQLLNESHTRFAADLQLLNESHTRFAADLQLLNESQSQLTARVDRIAAKVDALVEIQAHSETRLSQLEAHFETRLSRLEESFVLLVQMAKLADERQDATDRRIAKLAETVDTLAVKVGELAENQKSSDDRLNTLIGVFERYISEGRNGSSQR